MNHHCDYRYLDMNGEKFFTICLLPEKDGKFPIVVFRSPYVKSTVDMSEESVLQEYYSTVKHWLERGYVVIFQHCRGQGKSSGAFVPYVHEREDGLSLREWIRRQPFYNGEIYLIGSSYDASLHYATAPFENDIKGVIFEVQDSERYRLWYRNGQMRKGHANWHFGLYKEKCSLNKSFSIRSFSSLPLKGLSKAVLGEEATDFEQMLEAASPSHEFWNTVFGGNDAKDAVSDADIPILLTTGYNDFYVGGVFKMWQKMSERTKKKSALLVSPYNHGDSYYKDGGVVFPNGRRKEAFGEDYRIAWLDHIRNGTPIPYETGVITYYRTFENVWESDFYKAPTKDIRLPLGTGVSCFDYEPLCPPALNEEGHLAEESGGRSDVLSVCTQNFDRDVFVRGQMRCVLAFESDAPDTSVYVRISIKKPEYTYVLRHDITSLCYQLGSYEKNSIVSLELCFDEYAFLIKAGEALQIDISSTNDNGYVCHTNRKGEYYLQDGADVAHNKVYLDRSYLILPIE